MIMEKVYEMSKAHCSCGKKHEFKGDIISGKGAIIEVPSIVKKYGCKKPYVLSDHNTYLAAGKTLCDCLTSSDISYSLFSFQDMELEPDEKTVGSAFMHMRGDSDMIIAVGSGVINDTSKILALHTKLPYVIVATAPSMDGYASMTSSVTLDGVKTSLPSRCADAVVGDSDILAKCPKKMILSGIGDMLAKYVSICEWRIAALVCGEYYCEEIADLIRTALKTVVNEADSAILGDPNTVNNVFEALNASSIAMNYAGISRPASGAEHYISHIIDMRGVEFNSPVELHGIQCAIGTLATVKLYEKLKKVVPNKENALKYVEGFDLEKWNESLRALLGRSADTMILLEEKEGKYDKKKHSERLDIIIEKWDEILKIIGEELPSSKSLESFMLKIGLPTELSEIGIDKSLVPDIFKATKDIRDKYVLPRLLWDLGIIDEFAEGI